MADYQRNRCPFCGQTEEWMVWVNRLHRQESFAECGKCLIKGPVVAGKDSVEAFILQYRRWEACDGWLGAGCKCTDGRTVWFEIEDFEDE